MKVIIISLVYTCCWVMMDAIVIVSVQIFGCVGVKSDGRGKTV